MEDRIRLPLLDELIPDGLRYGANYLVEFEPHSLWYETSLTLCAQALDSGIRTDYHTFTHPPEDIRRQLRALGLPLDRLEEQDAFRIWDSYTVQTGLGTAAKIGREAPSEHVDLRSLKMADWDRGENEELATEVPEVEKKRLHVDDNTSILVQFNDEASVAEHFRTRTIPYVRKLELAAVHAIARGPYSDSFYSKFESFCDGILDFRARDIEDGLVQSMRVRVMRGAAHDSNWRRLELLAGGMVATGQTGQAKGSDSESPGAVDAARFLESADEIDLSRYSVVGTYLRFSDSSRNLLKDFRQKLVSAFDSTSRKHENYLLWAPPGSGKTSFVRQVSSSLGGDVRYLELNLAEAGEQGFRRVVANANDSEGPVLCFVDEVDSRGGQDWPFEALLGALDSEQAGSRRVFVLAGSSGKDIQEMKSLIASRSKGSDLLSRVPQGNDYSIPGITGLDNVVIFLSALTREALRLGRSIEEVEKLGLYFVAVTPHLRNARKLHEFAVRCAERIPVGDERLKYDAMFDAGDPLNKEFWVNRASKVPKLVNSFVRVRNASRAEQPRGERRLAAIMFTDMVGFTVLAQRNETLAVQLLDGQRRLVRPVLAKHRGREVKTTGDGFLVEFASALDAVECAAEVQALLKQENSKRPEERRMIIRIGVHLGDVIHEGSDVIGDAVNVASRIEPLAYPGGICISGQVRDSVSNKVDYRFETMGRPVLKNVSAEVEVFRVLGFGESAAVPPAKVGYPKDRIAVLPFRNISPDKADEYFADGLTEELIGSVSKTRGLRVIARTSIMKYKGVDKTVYEIGRELGVGSVLEGSVRKSGERVRVSVQLVETKDEEPKWSQDYDREVKDIFAIQSDIAQKVTEALREQVLGGVSRGPEGKTTVNPDAYLNYLRGRQALNKRTEEGLKQAIGFFDKALEIDPTYAKAFTGVADSYATLALLEFMAPKEAYPRAKEAVGRALALDPQLAEAHTSLGLIRFQYDWDWNGAEEEFTEAIRISPSYAPAHHFFADYLKALGRFDEALTEIGRAQELDPLSLAINTGVGHVLYLSGQYDKAIQQYRRAVDLDPTVMATHVWFGRPYLEKRMFPEAISELETAVRLSGESTLALAMLGHGLASAGRKEEATQILEKLEERSKTQYVPSYWVAVVYNGFRDKDQVIRWLKRAFEERSSWLVWSRVEPRFAWLRDDPEFSALMKAMHFP